MTDKTDKAIIDKQKRTIEQVIDDIKNLPNQYYGFPNNQQTLNTVKAHAIKLAQEVYELKSCLFDANMTPIYKFEDVNIIATQTQYGISIVCDKKPKTTDDDFVAWARDQLAKREGA